MIGLMRANLSRMLHFKAFWVCMIVCPALDVLSLILEILGNVPFRRTQVPLEPNLFGDTPDIVLLLAVFAGLFFGTEYSDGGLRNKLIVGHSRAAVCLSDLLTCITAGLLIFAVQFSTDLALGLAREFRQNVSTEELALRVLICIFAILALSAVFTLIGTLVSSKASSVTAAICLSLVLAFGSSLILNNLMQPEYLAPMTIAYPDEIDENGEPRVETVTEKNPNYVDGTLRTVYETLNDLLPSSQLLRMATNTQKVITPEGDSVPAGIYFGISATQTEETESAVSDSFAESAAPMIGYSLGILLLTTTGGILSFRKKNIR